MNNVNLTKRSIISDLINFSTEDKPLNSTEWFYPRYKEERIGERGEKIVQTAHNFQRFLTKNMREIQMEQFAKSVDGPDFLFIGSCGEGFFITHKKTGMVKAIRFYRAKGGKKEFLDAMIYAYKVKVAQINKELRESKEDFCNNGQFELKLVG